MEKIRLSAIEKTVTKSIMETFESMLSLDLTKVGKVTDEGLNDQRMVGVVHYAGEVVGKLSLHVSQELAVLITTAMLGVESTELHGDEEVKDVLGELTNIVSGNLKSDFLNADLSCVISTPNITRGSDFKIQASEMAITHQWVFRHQDHEILIDLAVEEDLGAKVFIPGLEALSADEVTEKINSVDITTTVINSVIDVYYTMLSMEIESIQEVPPDFREDKRTVGTVSFAGDVHGMFNIQVNDSFARTMAAAMLGMEEDEIESEEEVFDVIREMSNIIGGNLKSAFVDVGLSCVLSTPAITNGFDFRVEALNIIKTERLLFNCNGHTIIIDAGIKKDGDSGDAAETEQGQIPADTAESEKSTGDEISNLDLILDIPLNLTVELGRTRKRVHELLKTGSGSVIGLNQLEGEPVDVLVNDTLIAKGEVLVEKEKYGIRIVEVVSRGERVKSLR
ncbi:MAG: flagellar motor switch protein FliN [Desulfobacteraceae bacterium]|jgi:flagellar motor switch protein FliN